MTAEDNSEQHAGGRRGSLADRIAHFRKAPPQPREQRDSPDKGSKQFWWNQRMASPDSARSAANRSPLAPIRLDGRLSSSPSRHSVQQPYASNYPAGGRQPGGSAVVGDGRGSPARSRRLSPSVPARPATSAGANPGGALDALQRLAASNPRLHQALLGLEKDQDGRISEKTMAKVRAAMEEATSAASSRRTSRASSPEDPGLTAHAQRLSNSQGQAGMLQGPMRMPTIPESPDMRHRHSHAVHTSVSTSASISLTQRSLSPGQQPMHRQSPDARSSMHTHGSGQRADMQRSLQQFSEKSDDSDSDDMRSAVKQPDRHQSPPSSGLTGSSATKNALSTGKQETRRSAVGRYDSPEGSRALGVPAGKPPMQRSTSPKQDARDSMDIAGKGLPGDNQHHAAPRPRPDGPQHIADQGRHPSPQYSLAASSPASPSNASPTGTGLSTAQHSTSPRNSADHGPLPAQLQACADITKSPPASTLEQGTGADELHAREAERSRDPSPTPAGMNANAPPATQASGSPPASPAPARIMRTSADRSPDPLRPQGQRHRLSREYGPGSQYPSRPQATDAAQSSERAASGQMEAEHGMPDASPHAEDMRQHPSPVRGQKAVHATGTPLPGHTGSPTTSQQSPGADTMHSNTEPQQAHLSPSLAAPRMSSPVPEGRQSPSRAHSPSRISQPDAVGHASPALDGVRTSQTGQRSSDAPPSAGPASNSSPGTATAVPDATAMLRENDRLYPDNRGGSAHASPVRDPPASDLLAPQRADSPIRPAAHPTDTGLMARQAEQSRASIASGAYAQPMPLAPESSWSPSRMGQTASHEATHQTGMAATSSSPSSYSPASPLQPHGDHQQRPHAAHAEPYLAAPSTSPGQGPHPAPHAPSSSFGQQKQMPAHIPTLPSMTSVHASLYLPVANTTAPLSPRPHTSSPVRPSAPSSPRPGAESPFSNRLSRLTAEVEHSRRQQWEDRIRDDERRRLRGLTVPQLEAVLGSEARIVQELRSTQEQAEAAVAGAAEDAAAAQRTLLEDFLTQAEQLRGAVLTSAVAQQKALMQAYGIEPEHDTSSQDAAQQAERESHGQVSAATLSQLAALGIDIRGLLPMPPAGHSMHDMPSRHHAGQNTAGDDLAGLRTRMDALRAWESQHVQHGLGLGAGLNMDGYAPDPSTWSGLHVNDVSRATRAISQQLDLTLQHFLARTNPRLEEAVPLSIPHWQATAAAAAPDRAMPGSPIGQCKHWEAEPAALPQMHPNGQPFSPLWMGTVEPAAQGMLAPQSLLQPAAFGSLSLPGFEQQLGQHGPQLTTQMPPTEALVAYMNNPCTPGGVQQTDGMLSIGIPVPSWPDIAQPGAHLLRVPSRPQSPDPYRQASQRPLSPQRLAHAAPTNPPSWQPGSGAPARPLHEMQSRPQQAQHGGARADTAFMGGVHAADRTLPMLGQPAEVWVRPETVDSAQLAQLHASAPASDSASSLEPPSRESSAHSAGCEAHLGLHVNPGPSVRHGAHTPDVATAIPLPSSHAMPSELQHGTAPATRPSKYHTSGAQHVHVQQQQHMHTTQQYAHEHMAQYGSRQQTATACCHAPGYAHQQPSACEALQNHASYDKQSQYHLNTQPMQSWQQAAAHQPATHLGDAPAANGSEPFPQPFLAPMYANTASSASPWYPANLHQADIDSLPTAHLHAYPTPAVMQPDSYGSGFGSGFGTSLPGANSSAWEAAPAVVEPRNICDGMGRPGFDPHMPHTTASASLLPAGALHRARPGEGLCPVPGAGQWPPAGMHAWHSLLPPGRHQHPHRAGYNPDWTAPHVPSWNGAPHATGEQPPGQFSSSRTQMGPALGAVGSNDSHAPHSLDAFTQQQDRSCQTAGTNAAVHPYIAGDGRHPDAGLPGTQQRQHAKQAAMQSLSQNAAASQMPGFALPSASGPAQSQAVPRPRDWSDVGSLPADTKRAYEQTVAGCL